MMEPIVRDYLLLGLRLGRHVDGFVDCWFGDPGLSRQVAAEPLTDPRELAGHAARLRSELDGSDLARSRRRFLGAQLTALELGATRLAGAAVPFLAEVEAYFETRIGLGDPDHYAAVHEEIGALLPGNGDLRGRVEAFYERNTIPPGKLQRAVQAVSDELRARARPLFDLPEHERVEYEVVTDQPWNAFNHYLGGFRSSIALNAEAGRSIAALPLIATHEAYPGHHTEHCRKEAGLVDALGHGEQCISLVNTPQCLIAEGTAELAVTALLGDGWGPWTARILADQGVYIDGEQVERMLNLIRRLMPARQDAAIMLHDQAADPGDVADHLERWLLLPADRARQMVRFMTDPLWRAYSTTYVEGARLVADWLAARPAGVPIAKRYRQLLDEPLTPADLGRADATDGDGR